MTRFTDGKSTIEIYMAIWEASRNQCGPSFEEDFFDVGSLPKDGNGAYIVEDTEYLIEQVNDWHYGRGDYLDDYEGAPGHTPGDRVFIAETCRDGE